MHDLPTWLVYTHALQKVQTGPKCPHVMFTLKRAWQRVLKTLTMKDYLEVLNDIDQDQMAKRPPMLRYKRRTLFSTDQQTSTPQCKSNVIQELEQ